MSNKIRCAVLGLGRLGYWHAGNLRYKIKDADLRIVVDPLEGRAEQVARELEVPKWAKNADDVFTDDKIDAVIIVTPTTTHAELIKKAAQNGKHIFVEKPITHTLEEADEVIKVIQENEVYCQVGFMRRFDRNYAEAKRRVKAGDIGKPLYFKGITRDGVMPPPNFIKHSGGLFLDFSIHDYDTARFFLEAEVTSVTGLGSVIDKQYVAEFNDVDQALTYLTFDSGAAADVEASRNANYGYDIRAEIVGTDGAIQIGSMQQHDLKILTKHGSTHDIYPDFPSQFLDAYHAEMESFIESLLEQKKPAVNEHDGKVALEIAIKATESYRTGQTIQLSKAIS